MADDSLESSTALASQYLAELKTIGNTSLPYERSETLLKNEKYLRKGHVDDAKELIKKLQQDFDAKVEEGSVNTGFSENTYQERKVEKEKAEKEMKDNLKKLETEKDNCIKTLSQLTDKLKILEEKKNELEAKRDKFVPWKKDSFALYLSATGIHWNFGCKDNEIRGYVTGKNDIKPFSINADEHDGFYVANYLWDVVETAFDQ